ncbi:hypothetical protein DESC_120010 [Desulfosarcina cetonica]|nr:hypothetical protein DESC_120010 [Desulfosarcina cetonica]
MVNTYNFPFPMANLFIDPNAIPLHWLLFIDSIPTRPQIKSIDLTLV